MINYTTIDRILLGLSRELGDVPFDEPDMVDWIGEAMEFLSVAPVLQEMVAILPVSNFRAELPSHITHIIQIASIKDGYRECKKEEPILNEILNCDGSVTFKYEYKRVNSLISQIQELIPMRRSSDTLAGDNGCNKSSVGNRLSDDEYKIIGTTDKEILLPFSDGKVVMSYLSLALDEDTGYPLIPDQPDFISAVGYYVKWKVSEAMSWRGREGYSQLLGYAKAEWLRYAKQAKNWAKMPKSLEDWQASMEIQYNMIPDLRAYYKGFHGLNKLQQWR